MTIHDIHGKNRWCGPAAISALTGYSTDDAGALIRSIGDQPRATGTSFNVLAKVLREFGLDLVASQHYGHRPKSKRPTFAQVLRTLRYGITYLVIAGDHYVVLRNGVLHDSINRTGADAETSPKVKRRSRTYGVYAVEYPAAIATPATLKRIGRRQAESRSVGATLAKARRLAAAHGIEIELDRGYGGTGNKYWVYPPEHVQDHPDYPFEGHHCLFRDEVLDRVLALIEFQPSICDPSAAKK